MRKVFEIGGVVAAAVLIAFGITAIVMGFNGRNTVHSNLRAEAVVGTPDMTPKGIAAEAKSAGLKNVQNMPTCTVANLPTSPISTTGCTTPPSPGISSCP